MQHKVPFSPASRRRSAAGSEPEPEINPLHSVEERLSLLEKANQRQEEEHKRREKENQSKMRLLEMETQRLRLEMRFLKTKDKRGPAVFTFSKAQVRATFAPGASLESPEEGIPILGFEFGVAFFPGGMGLKTLYGGTPIPEDGCVPAVNVWVKQNPDLGSNVPRCVNLKGTVALNGVEGAFGHDKFFEERIRPGLLSATSWVPCDRRVFTHIKSSSLYDVDTKITVSISELVLQDGTVLSRH